MMSNDESQSPLEKLEQELIACKACPRLVAWREQVGQVKRKAYSNETYWSKPVPGFGDEDAQVLIVGLAPGAHGSNRTGRMFTGDNSGRFLYPALWRAGFANQSDGSSVGDGLVLKHIWITAVCRCVPPDNKPSRDEIQNCHSYLEREMSLLPNLQGIVALGKLAYDEMLKLFDLSAASAPVFKHNGWVAATEQHPWILASYHPSQQNTQTGRLTASMFDSVWATVNQQLK